MSEAVKDAQAERARKVAQIEKLARDEEQEGLGRIQCSCTKGVFASFNDTDKPARETLRARAVFLIQFPDNHTMAEHTRRARMAILRADPNFEPPTEWCSGELAKAVKRELHSLADDRQA